MTTRDPEKIKAARKRYRDKKKAEKFGPESLKTDLRGKHGNHATGADHGNWNDGRWLSPQGYVGIRVPEGHHLRMANGYAYEHQLVMEKKLGRRLLPGELVHHENGVRSDNHPDNLELTTRSDHARDHVEHGWTRDALGRFNNELRTAAGHSSEVAC